MVEETTETANRVEGSFVRAMRGQRQRDGHTCIPFIKVEASVAVPAPFIRSQRL
jgi:hypothetical protein